MCWVQRTLVLAWLSPKSAKLLASNCAERAWHVQNQPNRAYITRQEYHPLEPYGGNDKWSSSGFLGVLGAKNLDFGLALAKIC
jgi:hypothetical protein